MQIQKEEPLSPTLHRAFVQFLECTPPERLSRHIRTMFLESLRDRQDIPSSQFNHTVDDLLNLFDLLDRVEDEKK